MSLDYARQAPTGQVGGHVRSTRLGQTRPYAAVPHDLTADLRLKPLDVRLSAVLLRYARAKATCWPGIKALALDLARCERTVQYSLRRLSEAGWISTRPDPNPTGRLIVLTWREARCTPPVQAPYSQGMPRPQAVAPKAETEEKGKGLALAVERAEAERPMTTDEAQSFFAVAGFLDRPSNDPLRQMAERSMARAAAPGDPLKALAAGVTVSARGWRRK